MTELPNQPILEYASPAANVAARPAIPGVMRFCGIYAGAVLPLICFGFSLFGFPMGPDWQSGKFADYVKLFLSARSAWPFFPLLGCCMLSIVLASVSPTGMGSKFVVRLGVYTGVVLAGQYSVIMLIAFSGDGTAPLLVIFCGLLAIGVPAGLMALLNFSFRRFGRGRVWLVLGGVIAVTTLFGLLIAGRVFAGVIGGAIFLSLLVAPGWALATYLAMSVCLWRLTRESGARGDGVVWLPVWAAGFAASWALAVQQAIRTYQSLPTSPPNRCYVATAAARGHRRLVRARRGAGGVIVNDQLQRLKCAEIALATLCPRLHRSVRRAYDRVGPALAAGMVHPALADAGYLLLKPPEWAAVFLLRRLVRDFDTLARGIYSADADP